jgi:hypothetical protein
MRYSRALKDLGLIIGLCFIVILAQKTDYYSTQNEQTMLT